MLSLIPSSMIHLLGRSALFAASFVDGPVSYGITPRVAILGGRREYQFSWKPRASAKNFCGNRTTDHYQLTGQLYGRMDVRIVSRGIYELRSLPKHHFSELVTPSTQAHTTDYNLADGSLLRYGSFGTGGHHFYGYVYLMKTRKGFWANFYTAYWRWDGNYVFQGTAQSPSPVTLQGADPRNQAWAMLVANASPPDYCRSRAPVINPAFDSSAGLKSSELRRLKRTFENWMPTTEPDDDPYLLGDATQKAADGARYFDGNTAVYLAELVKLRESLADLKRLLSGNVTLKSLSSLYLQGQYGLRLTLLDTWELGKSLARAFDAVGVPKLFSVTRGRETSEGTGHVAGCKLYYDPNTANGFARTVKGLMDWDLFPAFTNIWDIIPYSFVVDWFADVEGFLSAYDTHTYLSVLNVFSALYTYKKVWRAYFPGCALCGDGGVTVSHFRRWSTPKLIEPTPHFSGGQPLSHIPEGAALIIQALK